MVDDLVGPEDDDDYDGPPTPPVQAMEPASLLNSENAGYCGQGLRNGSFNKGTSPRGIAPTRTPEIRPNAESWHSSNSPLGRSSQRLQSVSSLWSGSLPQNTNTNNPVTPAPNPNSIRGPSRLPSNASVQLINSHSRVNSSASLKSPLPNQDGWSSFEPTPVSVPHHGHGRYDQRLPSLHGSGGVGSFSGLHSPLLFGAGGGPWSVGPRKSLPNSTPPNGQGG